MPAGTLRSHCLKSGEWCRHEKAVGRLREETRALRLLTQQAVEERAKLAAKALVCSHICSHDCLTHACTCLHHVWALASGKLL